MAVLVETSDSLTELVEYQRIREGLWQERVTFDPHYRELADFVLPRRPRFLVTDRNRGDKRSQKIINETATLALRTAKSGMHAGMTSPARPWMRLTTPDPALAKFPAVKLWLQDVTDLLMWAYGRSNLYNVLLETYGDMLLFATAAQSILEDDQHIFRVYSHPIGSYALGLDYRGIANAFVSEDVQTVRQLVGQFGIENVSTRTRDLYAKAHYEELIEVCWLIYPNEEADARKLSAKYLPFKSIWFEKTSKDGLLRQSGFKEFPTQTPRWSVTGKDYYGTDCPGMTALGSIKALQTMEKRKAQAVEKMVNPPLQAGVEMMSARVTSLPGEVNYVPNLQGPNTGLRPVYQVEPKVGELRLDIKEIQQLINDSFYVNAFRLISARAGVQPMNEKELAEWQAEKLIELGPMLNQSITELLSPTVDRTYAILDRQGLIPLAPRELANVTLKVEFTSMLAQAQKLVGVESIERFLAVTAQIAQVHPIAKYKISAERAVDDLAELYGVNPNLVVSDDDAHAAAQADAKAQQAQQQADIAAKMAMAGKNLAQTPMGGDTALTQLQQQAGA